MILSALVLVAFAVSPPDRSLSHRTYTIAAVGDIMLGRWVGKRISQEGTSAVFAGVRGQLSGADVAIGNLECALSDRPFASFKRIQLRADRGSAKALALGGLDFVSLANNHSGDCGPAGTRDTETALHGVGVRPVGPGLSAVIRELGPLRLGLLALSALPPTGVPSASGWREAIRGLRAKTDIVVISIHWGVEGSLAPSPAQTWLASEFAELGVDLVLGHHPHVLQPTRWIPRPNGQRLLVAFSLGNFVFDAIGPREKQSEILMVDIQNGKIQGFRSVPVQIQKGFPILRHR